MSYRAENVRSAGNVHAVLPRELAKSAKTESWVAQFAMNYEQSDSPPKPDYSLARDPLVDPITR